MSRANGFSIETVWRNGEHLRCAGIVPSRIEARVESLNVPATWISHRCSHLNSYQGIGVSNPLDERILPGVRVESRVRVCGGRTLKNLDCRDPEDCDHRSSAFGTSPQSLEGFGGIVAVIRLRGC